MFSSLSKNFCIATQHHPAKLSPVFIVTIGNEGDSRVSHDIAQPLQRPRSRLFRLLVDRDEKVRALNSEAHRNDMWAALGIGARQAPHPLRRQKSGLIG